MVSALRFFAVLAIAAAIIFALSALIAMGAINLIPKYDELAANTWSAAATTLTCLVISCTAAFGFRQLAHADRANQLTAILTLQREAQDADFTASEIALTRVNGRLEDEKFRDYILRGSECDEADKRLFEQATRVANFYETIGLMTKQGLVKQELVCEIWADNVHRTWDHLEGLARMMRTNVPAVWQYFEYLARTCDKSDGKFLGPKRRKESSRENRAVSP